MFFLLVAITLVYLSGSSNSCNATTEGSRLQPCEDREQDAEVSPSAIRESTPESALRRWFAMSGPGQDGTAADTCPPSASQPTQSVSIHPSADSTPCRSDERLSPEILPSFPGSDEFASPRCGSAVSGDSDASASVASSVRCAPAVLNSLCMPRRTAVTRFPRATVIPFAHPQIVRVLLCVCHML